jgi:hypothetical protein
LADSNQYLRLTLEDKHYLMPSSASIAIEQRDSLVLDSAKPPIVAWRQAHLERWPVFALDPSLRLGRSLGWQRAVFLQGRSYGIGFVVTDAHQLSRTDLPVVPFTPLGPAPTRFGHLFNAASIEGPNVTLVFDTNVLSAYLQGLGDGA